MNLRHRLSDHGDYAIRWAMVAAIAVLAISSLHVLGISLDLASAVPLIRTSAKFLLLLPPLMLLGWLVPRFKRFTAVPTDFVLSLVQLTVGVIAIAPISYVAAALAAHVPLLDATLARLDVVLFGFDWDAAAHWVDARPAIEQVLSSVYFDLPLQLMGLMLIGSFRNPGDRNGDLIWLMLTTSCITIGISVVTPALGKIGHLGTGQIDAINEIRSGAWHAFSYDRFEGIINFPSLHTALALVFIYVAARLHRLALVVFLPINLVMLVSISPIGGHYLVDLFGGAAVAVLSIAVVRLVRERIASTAGVEWNQSIAGAAVTQLTVAGAARP